MNVLNWSPGTAEEQQPHRSELVGINGTLSALKIIVDYYKITNGTIEIACDNMEAKNQSEKDKPYILISQWIVLTLFKIYAIEKQIFQAE